MRKSSLVAVLAALLLSLIGAAPAPAAQPVPLAEPHHAKPKHKPKRTTIVLATGCTACFFTLEQAVVGRNTVWRSKEKSSSDGTATFRIDRKRTRGMSINARTEDAGGLGFVAVTNLRSEGFQPGQPTSFADIDKAERAYGCFAGTRAKRLVITIGYDILPDTEYGQPAYLLRTWADPAVATVGPGSDTYRGTLGHQDAYYCPKR